MSGHLPYGLPTTVARLAQALLTRRNGARRALEIWDGSFLCLPCPLASRIGCSAMFFDEVIEFGISFLGHVANVVIF